MNLHDHEGREPLPFQTPGDPDHRDLDQVGGRPLNRGVDRHPLGELPDGRLGTADLRKIPPAAEKRRHESVPPGLIQHAVEILPDPLIFLKIAVDVSLGELLRDPKLPGEAERAHPVEDAEIDHLRLPPHVGIHHLGEDAEDVGRGPAVDVFAVGKCPSQRLVAGEVREDPELDLRIIGGEDLPAGRRDERLPDPFALEGPDRNVLQIRVAAGEASRRGHGLVVRRVNPARPGVNHLREGIHVSRFELGHPAVGQDLRRQLMPLGERGQHIHVRGVPLLGLAAPRQSQLLEKDGLELLRGVDVEFFPGQPVDLLFGKGQELLDFLRHRLQQREVKQHAVALHPGEDRNQRHLHIPEQPVDPCRRDLAGEIRRQLRHGAGATARVIRGLPDGKPREGDRLGAAADDLLLGGNPPSQVVENRFGKIEAVLRGVDQIGGQHRVAAQAPKRNAAFG